MLNRLALLVAVAAIHTSCVCAPAPCTQDGDCASGQQCRDNQCLLPCTQSSTCSSGNTCADGYCRATCTNNGGCSGAQACAGGACRPTMCGNTSCAADNICVDGRCTSAQCAGVICPNGQSCAAGTCYSTSCGGTQCGAGQVCLNSVCTDAACLGVICPGNTICLAGTCVSPGDPLPYSLVCDAMARGYKNSFTNTSFRCSPPPLGADDLAHMPFLSISSGLSTRPSTGTVQGFFALFTCGPAANGLDAGILSLALSPLEDSMDAGRIRYDGTKARACINASYSVDAGYSSACHEVFVPLVTPGGACTRTEECPNDHYCKGGAYGTCAGTCIPRLNEGASCEPTRDLCANGSCSLEGAVYLCRTPGAPTGAAAGADCPSPGSTTFCASPLRCVRNPALPLLPDGGQTGTCTEPSGLGGPCALSAAAGPGCTGSCVTCYSTNGTTGVCRERGAVGAACRLDGDCGDFQLCLSGSCTALVKPGQTCLVTANGARGNCLWADQYCRQSAPDAGSGTCVDIPTLNQACGSNRYDLTDVCAGGFCSQGTCLPEPTLGQPCLQGRCAGSLRCESRDAGTPTCYPQRGLGEACTLQSDCDGTTRCSGNVCIARFAAGSVCTSDSECASNNCLDGAKVCAETCFSPLSIGLSYSTGCPGGLRDWAILLAFSSLALVAAGRRRRIR